MSIYIWILILTVLLSVIAAIIAFRRRNFQGAKPLFFLMLAVTIYAFCYIFEITSKTLETKLLWYNLEYFGIAFIPFLWLFFALEYCGFDSWIINKKIYFFAVIPVITIIMVWTNKYHGFMLHDIGISTGIVHEISKIPGPWYYVNTVNIYGSSIVGSLIIISTAINLPAPLRKQGFILSIGSIFPIVGSMLYIFKVFPVLSFDLTPFACSLSGLLFLWSVYKLKTLQIYPIAREKVFNIIEDGVIVINNDYKIVDLNLKSQQLFEIKVNEEVGQDLDLFFLIKNLGLKTKEIIKNKKVEFFLDTVHGRNYYTVTVIPFEKKKDRNAGHILVFHDITENKEAEMILSRSNQKIEGLNKLAFELDKSNSEEEVYQKSFSATKSILGFSYGCFIIFENEKLNKKFCSSTALKKITENTYFGKNFILGKYNENTTRALRIADCKDESVQNILANLKVNSILCVPVFDLGIALFFGDEKNIFNQENIKMAELLVGQSVEALKRLWLQDSLREQAERDSLVGVYNRRYFNDFIIKEMERSKRYDYPIIFMMADIDRFKEINDRYGHQMGDKVLYGIGNTIERQIRKIDTLVRYGGDEFLIIMPGVKNGKLESFIKRLNKAVHEWNDRSRLIDFEIKISIGESCWEHSLNEPIEKIIHQADMNMYKNKKKKKY